MATVTYREALNQALAEEMERDPDVFLMGEEVGLYNGAYKVSKGLLDRFGEKRIVDTPITELGFAGLGVGAAMVGLRPVIEFMTFNFSMLALDQVFNSASKVLYMSGGQFKCPIVFRGPNGAALQLSAQHSQAMESTYAHYPGLKICVPATPADAKGLLKAAIRDPNPVVFLEHKRLYSVKGEAPPAGEVIPLGRANVARTGADLTIATIGKGVPDALAAAEQLSGDGLDVEVVDLRTLRPLDVGTVLESVARTNRLLAVEEGPRTGGWATGLLGAVAEAGLHDLDDAWILATEETPVPYSPPLEDAFLPDTAKLVEGVRTRLGAGVA
jgi:pyruvate dehydrogenase E1 component beta subunit